MPVPGPLLGAPTNSQKGQARHGPACQRTGTGGDSHKSEGPVGTGEISVARGHGLAMLLTEPGWGLSQSSRSPQATQELRGQKRSKGSLGPAEPSPFQSAVQALGHTEAAHAVLGSAQVPTSARGTWVWAPHGRPLAVPPTQPGTRPGATKSAICIPSGAECSSP